PRIDLAGALPHRWCTSLPKNRFATRRFALDESLHRENRDCSRSIQPSNRSAATVRECREDTRHHFYRVRAAQSVLCSQRKIRARANRLLAGQLPKPLSSGQSQIQRRTSGTLISSIVTEPNRCGLRPTDAARIFRVGRLVPWNLSVSPQPRHGLLVSLITQRQTQFPDD